MIVAHLILARKHGELTGYPVIAAFGVEGHTAVLAKYREIVGSEGEAFRAETAEMELITIDGDHFSLDAYHSFPDPARVEADRVAKVLSDALRIKAEADMAQAKLDAAEAALETAQFAELTLSAEQEALLAEHQAKLDAAQQLTAARELPNEAEQLVEQNRIAEETRARAEAANQLAKENTAALKSAVAAPVSGAIPLEVDPNDGLDDEIVADLKVEADLEGIDITGLTLKADIIARIRTFRALHAAHTVEELKSLAVAHSVDVAGAKAKADYVNALAPAAATPPVPDSAIRNPQSAFSNDGPSLPTLS